MISAIRSLPEFNLVLLARRYGLNPHQIAVWGIISAVLLASLVVGLRTSILYLALPLGVGVALLFLRQPGLGVVLTLLGGMIIPFNGPGGVNLTILGILFLSALWLLGMIMKQGDIQFDFVQVTRPALLLLVVATLALVIGQISWYRTQAAPMSAQIGGFMVFVTSIAALLLVGHQIKETRWLAILTTVVIVYGALHMIGWIEPHAGRYIRHLYQAGATTSMFWTWVVTLAFSQALFNRRLLPGWRVALLGVVALTFYVAYIMNGDWKSGWMPALISVGVLLLLRSWRFGYLLAPFGIIPAVDLIRNAVATDEYSYSTRLDAWSIVGEIIKANPILGLGPANYYWYTPLFRIRGYAVNFNSHNQYVDLIAQTGFLGFFVYLWLMLAIGWLGWRLRHRVAEGFEKAYVYGVLAGWVATVAAGVFGDWVLPFVYNVGLLGVRSSILPWLFLGGLLVLERKYRQTPPTPAPTTNPHMAPTTNALSSSR
jgi:O-antigen ligase